MLCLSLLVYFIVSGWTLRAYAALALATLSKLVPALTIIFLSPLFWGFALFAGLVGAGFLPFYEALPELVGTGETFTEHWRFNSGFYRILDWVFGEASIVGYLVLLTVLGIPLRSRLRNVHDSLERILWLLGLAIVLGPVVHAWYVTWLIPLACLTRSRTWISFSAVVYLSFLVMLDGVERPWARIDPHPAFRMVKLATRFSRGRGRLDTQVHDSVEGLSSDSPSAVLSSSQLNALAVSLFLSLNLALPRLPVEAALLDDPIQSLDDINLLGLVDLLRRTKDKRQLIVSTHDERFGKLLARKLRPTSGNQRTSVIELSGWTRPRSPTIRS